MQRRKYASLVDLKAGYHNIPFEPISAKYATFVCHRGKFRWKRMPFGLSNASRLFMDLTKWGILSHPWSAKFILMTLL